MARNRSTVYRALHDVGLAAWFGGNLAGVLALNGASKDISDPTERVKVASTGWGRWAPVNAAAIGANLIGSAGILVADRKRVAVQKGATATSVTKTALTVAALASTALNGVLGGKMAKHSGAPATGATVPSTQTPPELAKLQQQQRVAQWLTPLFTGALVALASLQSEQQRPSDQFKGGVKRIVDAIV